MPSIRALGVCALLTATLTIGTAPTASQAAISQGSTADTKTALLAELKSFGVDLSIAGPGGAQVYQLQKLLSIHQAAAAKVADNPPTECHDLDPGDYQNYYTRVNHAEKDLGDYGELTAGYYEAVCITTTPKGLPFYWQTNLEAAGMSWSMYLGPFNSIENTCHTDIWNYFGFDPSNPIATVSIDEQDGKQLGEGCSSLYYYINNYDRANTRYSVPAVITCDLRHLRSRVTIQGFNYNNEVGNPTKCFL